ncbi:hypothetical protein [Bacteroidaceae bacterium]|jgi:hypothetical protein
MKKNTKKLFQYPDGFKGIELIQSKNDEGTELAAWLSNPGGPGSYALIGYVRPKDWDKFQEAFNSLMSTYIVPLEGDEEE